MSRDFRIKKETIRARIVIGGKPAQVILDGKTSEMSIDIKTLIGTIEGVAFEDMISQAHYLSTNYDLIILDAPKFTNLLNNISKEKIDFLRQDKICFNSAKYFTKNRYGDTIFSVAHSQGPLANQDVSKYLISRNSNMFVDLDFQDLNMLKNNVQEIHFLDLMYNFKNTPKPKEFIVYADMNDTDLIAYNEPKLSYDMWMTDDVIMMSVGGVEERAILGEQLFKKEKRTFIRNEFISPNKITQHCAGFIILGPEDYGLYTSAQKSEKGRMILSSEILLSKNMVVSLEDYVSKSI